MAVRIESRLARSSRPCSAAVRLPTSRIGCIRALHRISSVATGDIDDDARRVNELLNGTGAHPVLERHDGEPWHVHFHAAGQRLPGTVQRDKTNSGADS